MLIRAGKAVFSTTSSIANNRWGSAATQIFLHPRPISVGLRANSNIALKFLKHSFEIQQPGY